MKTLPQRVVKPKTTNQPKAICKRQLVGWLVGFGSDDPLRQYFSLYRPVSQRGRMKRVMIHGRQQKRPENTHPHLRQTHVALPYYYLNGSCPSTITPPDHRYNLQRFGSEFPREEKSIRPSARSSVHVSSHLSIQLVGHLYGHGIEMPYIYVINIDTFIRKKLYKNGGRDALTMIYFCAVS